MAFRNHLGVGFVTVKHKNFRVTTSLNSSNFEAFVESIEDYDFESGHIPPGYEHRADLISNLFYGTPTLDWLICWFNNISDPFQQLNILDAIKIPKII